MQRILDLMIHPDKEVRYLITGGNASAVIGSDKSTTQGKFYHAESGFRLSQGLYLRLKRGFDLSWALVLLLLFPFTLILFDLKTLRAAWTVFLGQKTWIGYQPLPLAEKSFLPTIKNGVYNTELLILDQRIFPLLTDATSANRYYAKYYSPMMDFNLLYKEMFSK